jgi:holo-[acyl-carrier protein] synthase
VRGTGIDLVENERMREALDRWGAHFRDRVFLPSEQAYCESRAAPWRHYAGRFAVKEAVCKAFGTGVGESLSWLDIEVCRDDASGAPSVTLRGKGRELARRRGVARILVSLAHSREATVAQALLLGT